MTLILKINHSFIIYLIITLSCNFLTAQTQELDLVISKNPINQSYWWLEKNNFGRTPSSYDLQAQFKLENKKTTYQASIYYDLDKRGSRGFLINESFIKYQFSNDIFLRFGRYYRDFSIYLNDELSSGSMLISNNAQAMLKIGLVGSKKVNKKISFSYGIAHGNFDKNEIYNEAPFLHEKFIYLNIKKNKSQFSVGFVHEAIWAGSTVEKGKQPSSFDDFLRVFISADRKLEDYGENIPSSHLNALGNHLGIWDFSFQKNYGDRFMKLYYQHIFEDTSGLRFANKTDGLWGVELANYIPNNTTIVEYINTSNYNIDPPYVFDKYYYHQTYKLGWSYKNFTLGNPFIDHQYFLPTHTIYIASKGYYNSYNYEIKFYKKINIHDNIKFKISIEKSLPHNVNIGTFIVNNSENMATGFSLSYIF
jgi:hypothetical protein